MVSHTQLVRAERIERRLRVEEPVERWDVRELFVVWTRGRMAVASTATSWAERAGLLVVNRLEQLTLGPRVTVEQLRFAVLERDALLRLGEWAKHPT